MADGSTDSDLATLAYRFETAAFAGKMLHVHGVRISEALDEPYAAELTFSLADPDADVTEILGRDATIFIERLPLVRTVRGVVCQVHEGDASEGSVRALVVVVPAFALLAKKRNTRMFQKKSVPEILETVLAESLEPYGRSALLDLTASYPTREYCLQYQESDLDFVHRLMEEEGISYGFDHDGDTEVVVLRDRNGAFARVESATDPLEYQPHNLQAREREAVHRFFVQENTVTTSVALRDFDWTKSGDMAIEATQEGQDELGRVRESYEHGLGRALSITDYDEGVRRYQAEDSKRQKQVRHEAYGASARVGWGVSRVIGLAPGTTFDLTGHPAIGADGEYLVTRVSHESRDAVDVLEAQSDVQGEIEHYHNTFECIPLDVPYRPRRCTPKPRIHSVQTAVVTGPSGEEIHVDEHGRIKVQFHWDRENPADETSSCWIRVKQSWAGGAWGSWWVPRIGMEVVVQFVDGDPDRPLVTGSVYNGTNALPYPLPDEKTKSTIKSNSSPGGGGFNELRFEDKAGNEEIFTHAQKDYNEVVENDHNTLVHNNQTNTVDVDQTQEIGANQTETVHGNQEMTVDGNRTVHVKSNFDETVDGTETRHVAGDVTESFDASEERTVGANLTETVSGSVTRTVSADQSQTISAARDVTVSGSVAETISGALSQTVSGAFNTTTPAAHTMIATGSFTVDTPGTITMTAPGGIKVAAPGGYEQIDEGFTWVGGFWESTAAHSIGVWGAKTTITGAAVAAAGLKAGFTKIALEASGFELFANEAESETGAMDNEAGTEVDGNTPSFRG